MTHTPSVPHTPGVAASSPIGPADHVVPHLGSPTFELQPDEEVLPGLIRVGLALIDRTRTVLGTSSLDLDIRVHEARKSMKKTRAVFRMLRPYIGDEVLTIENETVRDAGRVLSEARDAAVLVTIFDILTGPAAPAIRASLVELAAEKRGAVTSATIERVIDSLGDTRERVGAWLVPLVHGHDGFDLISPGLRREYRRGRRRMTHAIADGTAEAFHQWRKPAKHLFYQLEILQSGWASEAPVLVQPARELAEVLGEEHDLAVLSDTIDTLGAGSEGTRSTVRRQIDDRRREVQAVACELGDSLYAAPPRDFIAPLHGLWAASRNDGPAG